VAPADSVETEKIIEYLAEYYDSPVYVRLTRMTTDVIFGPDYKFTFGKGIIIRPGTDITIISTGIMIFQALEAAEILRSKNISAEVIHMPVIKPIDEKMIIASAKKTGKIVTVEEHSIIGGLGSAVAEVISEKYPVILKRVGINDTFAESGTPEALFEKYGLTGKNLAKEALNVLKTKNGK
jgi:transketolase